MVEATFMFWVVGKDKEAVEGKALLRSEHIISANVPLAKT